VTVLRQSVYKQKYITVCQTAKQKHTGVSQTPSFYNYHPTSEVNTL